ncbi:class I SAM-dependent methyltransferase [Chryseobacterium pennipullorum]|uniref:Class I SAM-dependent methyltransferase n=1 Tax=Chryseobacterium pennipullorum TaxID=2258963 RepID=A0A3D9AYM6_9FLAO|nr:class I SAM-dependent methyltransferase [Chryseobacterium pennipullorum]REC46421.1 class I SAM-dependent methyltransferase [Chryseobacterium pennipullorum]
MIKSNVAGTTGYTEALNKFIEATLSIDFTLLHQDFISFIPKSPSRILDLGAGTGKDASALSAMSHSVTAIEPCEALLKAGKKLYSDRAIHWIQDSLPHLQYLDPELKFDFILASAVWHHLSPSEQHLALIKVSHFLEKNGIFALSLRNGPAGAGTCIFPTHTAKVVERAEQRGLKTLLILENQPSILPGKELITWSRLVFQKI